MRGEHPTVMAAAALLALTAVVSVASSEDATAPPAPAKTEQSAPPAVTILPNHEVEGILGREVRSSSADENMGRIVDVLVDRSGLVRAAIIDFGGFLGVGSRKIAVDWSALHFPAPAKPEPPVKLELNRDQVNAAPAYEDGKPVTVLSALGKLEPLPFE